MDFIRTEWIGNKGIDTKNGGFFFELDGNKFVTWRFEWGYYGDIIINNDQYIIN